MKFISFWVPSICLSDFSPIVLERQKDVSDTNCPNFLTLRLSKSFDLQVLFGDQKEANLTLVYKDSCGLFIYSFEEKEPLEDWHYLCLEKPGYHLFKELFHKHEFHDGEEDSILKAYIFDAQNFSKDIHFERSITHYLNFYFNKFDYYKEHIEGLNEKISPSRCYRPSVLLTRVNLREEICSAFGEFNYCQTLLHRISSNEEIAKNLHSVRRNLEIKLLFLDNIIFKGSFLIQLRLTQIGVVLTFLGLIISLIGLKSIFFSK